MKAIDLIATSLNRRDDVPNQELAKEIISSGRQDWVKELVENLGNKDKNIQSDCMKVLYEIGERGGEKLIAPYWPEFLKTLQSKNNRLVWGGMFALSYIVLEKSHELFQNLAIIETAIDTGSVITIDEGVLLLAKLASVKKFQKSVLPKLIDKLVKCPAKQFPMYVEKSAIAMDPDTKADFIGIIEIRYKEMEKDSQRKRLEKIIKKLKVL
jgi:hypothetical protein